MKKKFLDYAITSIRNYNTIYDEVRLAELRYGLEGIYLSVTKLIVIIAIALILGIFKEMIFMLLIFNILRTTGFGLHATKSWICLLSSTSVFIICPILAKIITINTIIKVFLSIVSTICVFLYAPADTVKRPLINEKKRNIYKFITTISCIVLSLIAIVVENNVISNLMIFGILTEVVMILPITYKIFNLSYNNYKNYKLING